MLQCVWAMGGDHPQLLVTGGLDAGDKVLSDVWQLDIYSGKWREVRSMLVPLLLNATPSLALDKWGKYTHA